MSYFDGIYLVIAMFVFIILIGTAVFMWNTFSPTFISQAPTSWNATIQPAMTRNFDFWNGSFAAMFLVLFILSVVLSVFVYSHPVFLVLWLLFNIITIFVWDGLNQMLVPITASSLFQYGQMADAIAFFQSDIPKIIMGINVLMAIAMLGKRGISG